MVDHLRAALRRRIGIDARALASFRIALGVVILVDLALRARNLTTFYADAGVLPRSLLAEAYPLAARFSLHAVSGEAWVAGLLFLLAALAAVALAVGYRTRLAAAVSLLLLASLQARNPFVLNAGDTLLWQLLGAGLLCPLGERWSVDAVRGRGGVGESEPAERSRFAAPQSALLLAVVLAVYVSNAVVKLRGDAWPAGEAVGRVFGLTYLHGPLGGLVPDHAALLAVATHGWLALLVASPLLVAAAGRIRAALAGILVVAHLSMAFALQIGVFPAVSAVALLPFFPPFVWDRIEPALAPIAGRLRSAVEGRSTPAESGAVATASRSAVGLDRPTRDRALAAVGALLLVSLLAWTAMGLGVVAAPDPVAAVSDPTQSDWDMFAPEPPSADDLVLATATTADGDRVDALYGDPVAADRPPSDARSYPTARWRKHFSLLAPDDAERVDATLAHLCDRAARLSGEETASVSLSSVAVDVSGGNEVRVRELGARRCR